MIFVGDIALPSHITLDTTKIEKVFGGQPVVANLEGTILKQEREKEQLNKKVLFNGQGSIALFKQMGIQLVSLANNHILDIPSSFKATRRTLEENDIQCVGAGVNRDEASKPVTLRYNGNGFTFLAFGWETIQCIPSGPRQKGVNPLQTSYTIERVRDFKKKNPDRVLILLMHWNYELEEYPQPFDRQLAHRCIEEGADAVIGCHSHCVQGIEFYRDAPIVYSLGNWMIPHHSFFSGKLRFPRKSNLQLAFEWEPGVEPICHWFSYVPENHNIVYIESERLRESERIEKLTPFKNLNHEEYIDWFKKHRCKKILLPVFKHIDDTRINKIKHYWVMLRDKLIQLLLVLRLKKIRREA